MAKQTNSSFTVGGLKSSGVGGIELGFKQVIFLYLGK